MDFSIKRDDEVGRIDDGKSIDADRRLVRRAVYEGSVLDGIDG